MQEEVKKLTGGYGADVYIEGTAEPVRVRFTYLSHPDIRTLATTYAPGTDEPATEPASAGAIETVAVRPLTSRGSAVPPSRVKV